MAKSHDDVLGHYADTFKSWPKQVGNKPTREALATIHGLGARPGKQALANALAMRPEGVTGSEIVIACGAPQLNKMRGFITDNLLKREAVPPRNGHTVYKLTLTAKGAARIKGKAAKATVEKPVAKAKPSPKVQKAAKAIKAARAEYAAAKVEPDANVPPVQPVETTEQPQA